MPKFTSYDETHLFYHCIGEGPPLICLAGGPGADVRTLGNLGGLDSFRTLILLDARAAGQSEVPQNRESCAYTAQAKDLESLRQHLEIDHLDILAHSAGVLTAQHYAGTHPKEMGKLILVTPAGRIGREVDQTEVAELRKSRARESWYPAAIDAWSVLTSGTVDSATQEKLEPLIAPFLYGTWSRGAQEHYSHKYANAPDWLFDAFYTGDPSPMDTPGRLALFQSVQTPVLVIAGREDCIAGTHAAQLTASTYETAEFAILPAAGHHPWIDNPDRFRNLISAFLHDPEII